MPTVPGFQRPGVLSDQQNRPSIEQLLMTAADMQSKGQLYQEPTSYSDPKATKALPTAGGYGTRGSRKAGKRR